ncbi:MAG: DUF2807 domain-containing protein [Treponema sp.]|jgi:hypothetical protein|nr:DUF2807 domain-containing protein [Treponema sp.]
MGKIIIIGFVVLLFIGIGFVSCLNFGKIKGNGDIKTTRRSILDFNSIVINGSAVVRVHRGQTNELSLTIDSNLEKYISSEVKDTILAIETRNCLGVKSTEFVIDVYTNNINNYTINGNGSLIILDGIFENGKSVKVIINGSGTFDGGGFRPETAELIINGSGKIRMGSTQALDIKINGSGQLLYYGDPVLKTKISGAGSIKQE